MDRRFLLALATTLSACAAPVAPPAAPTLRIGALATVESVAGSQVYDWSSQVVTGARLQRLRQAALPAADRRLLALTASLDLAGAGFAGSAATGRISAPAYDAARDRIYWLAENGWLLRRDRATGTDAAFPISATDGATPTDTFAQTQITLSKDGKRVYLCAASGRFYALDAQTGTNLMNSPYEMGGTAADMGYVPAPCVDALASRADGQVETVYAVTPKGTLFRFVVDGSGESLPPYMQKAETLSVTGYRPHRIGGPYEGEDRFRVAPVAIGGLVVLQVTKPDSSTFIGRSVYSGSHVFVDAKATVPTFAPMAAQVLAGWGSAHHYPGSQPAAIVVDDAMQPSYMFVPWGRRIEMWNIRRNVLAEQSGWRGMSIDLRSRGASAPAEGPVPDNRIGDEFRAGAMSFGTAVAVDPATERVFTLAHNVLYQLGYDLDPSLDPGTGDFDDEFFPRSDSFRTVYSNFPNKHFYAKTTLGRSEPMVSAPDVPVENTVPPYFDGTHVWAVDNFPRGDGTQKMTLNKFLPGPAGPTLVDAVDLGALAPSATTLDGRLTRVPGGPLLLTTAGASPRLYGF